MGESKIEIQLLYLINQFTQTVFQEWYLQYSWQFSLHFDIRVTSYLRSILKIHIPSIKISKRENEFPLKISAGTVKREIGIGKAFQWETAAPMPDNHQRIKERKHFHTLQRSIGGNNSPWIFPLVGRNQSSFSPPPMWAQFWLEKMHEMYTKESRSEPPGPSTTPPSSSTGVAALNFLFFVLPRHSWTTRHRLFF